MQLFAAVNLLQDGVEAFLIAVADHTKAAIDQNTKFDKYFAQIDAKIAPKELPFKTKLIRLNRIRVDSKHYGIQPNREECERLALAVREFFDEVSNSILGASFSTVSVIDLLRDGETKSVLIEAKEALEAGKFEECAISCRKALYLEIEHHYDISNYRDGNPGFLMALSDAPLYARSKQYIDENVSEPTDFIVYDTSSVNEKLLTQGADNTAYWNVWRLTPEVYKTKDGKWIVKQDFSRLDTQVLSANIELIFSATLDVVQSIHRTRQAQKLGELKLYYLDLNQENVPIYRKADKSSNVTGHTPPGMTKIDTDYCIEGLNDCGPYWHVSHLDFDKTIYLSGFIHNDFVK